jgi:hypothetical protein
MDMRGLLKMLVLLPSSYPLPGVKESTNLALGSGIRGGWNALAGAGHSMR